MASHHYPPEDSNKPETKTIKVSTTDNEAGYMVREGKPKGFYYLDHRTVDGRHALITDIPVTPGNVHDSVPYLSRRDRMRQRFGFAVEAVGLDAGYITAAICMGLEARDIYGVMGYRRPNKGADLYPKRAFIYDAIQDIYQCPQQQALHYRTTNRLGYREYAADPQQCKHCPQRHQCTHSLNQTKVVTRHVWQDAKERIDAHRLEEKGMRVYARRKETVERSFADAKQLHGHRYARYRGLAKVRGQCLLAGACQNMKKMAMLLAKAFLRLIWHITEAPIATIRHISQLTRLFTNSTQFNADLKQTA